MTPLIDGVVHHFEWRGLFDGVSILMDRETSTLWHHITGEGMYGPLAGTKLPTFNLLHMTVEQALETYPHLTVAISDRQITGEPSGWSPWLEKIPVLRGRLRTTLTREDTRRPTMDVGIGVWTENMSRYYPLEHLARQHVVIHEFDGRPVLIYYAPGGRAPGALYVQSSTASVDGAIIRLGNGDYLEKGLLYNAAGERKTMQRPMQLFTRWYGFALTHPETEVYEP